MNTPAGHTTVAPWVVTSDTGALLTFVENVFKGTEPAQVPLEDGNRPRGDPHRRHRFVGLRSTAGLSGPVYVDAMQQAQESPRSRAERPRTGHRQSPGHTLNPRSGLDRVWLQLSQ